MKWPIVLLSLAFATPSLAELTYVEAYDRVFAFVLYDLDVTVWGPGKGYIAPKCRGSRSDESCTFDEFINFVEFGEAASSPSYYELDGSYQLTTSTIVALADAIMRLSGGKFIDNVFETKSSELRIWNDYGFVIDGSQTVAPQRDISISRHLKNLEMVLGAVSLSRGAALNMESLATLRNNMKTVIWQVTEKESDFIKRKWTEIDWDETVKKYPEMKDPNSVMFKEITDQLQDFNKNHREKLTVKHKVMNMPLTCFIPKY
ncbi:hypothetical protein FSARC_11029 [Fusarium sarcochroum]|uniref:Receptor ligand binding region domain-containing protein n=1 Tax=Fusarium sarcochroum TaxID=1208366 RepID=A0A8H4X1H3_9HYPO|nr:hypothetical protein FSARC_11029 [Fusarium sarcochroum]